MTKEEIISKIIFEAERKIKQNTGFVVSLFCKIKDVHSNYEMARIIIKLCADEYGIQSEQLIGMSRVQNLCEARQMSMKFIKENTTFTLKDIGQLYLAKQKNKPPEPGKDHTTIIHGIKSIDNLLEYNKTVLDRYLRIKEYLNKIICL